MAETLEPSSGNLVSYRESEDENTTSLVQQLVNGSLQIDDYPPIRELKRIRLETNQALELKHFSTPHDRQLAETIQYNINGWIDTATDTLIAFVNFVGLMSTYESATQSAILTSDGTIRATKQTNSIKEALRRTFHRSCDIAVFNSKGLLLAINACEGVSEDLAIKTMIEQHRNDLQKFQQGEVCIDVPRESHAKLLNLIKNSKFKENPEIDEKAKQSSWSWDLASSLSNILIAVSISISVLLSKR